MSQDPFGPTKELSRDEIHDELADGTSTDTHTDPGSAIASRDLLQTIVKADVGWAITILKGNGVGRTLPLTSGMRVIVGRGIEADLQIDDTKLSRGHAAFTCEDGLLSVTDLTSRNGTFVEGKAIVSEVPLDSGMVIQVGQTLLRVQVRSRPEVEASRELHQSSLRDPLTRLYNRRHLDEQLGAELAYSLRHRTSLTVMVIDLDHFKQVNDELGHQAGDEVLRIFAHFLQHLLRREDLAARYGGDEFVVVARDVHVQGAEILAQRIRADAEFLAINWNGIPISITTSVGVATSDPTRPHSSAESLLAAADRCLYRAKGAGRNLVICDSTARSRPPA